MRCFFQYEALNDWSQDLWYLMLAANWVAVVDKICCLAGIFGLPTYFNMNLCKFFKLLLSQMQRIVNFSESHRLNRNYFSVIILLQRSTNNTFRFLLIGKWIFTKCFSKVNYADHVYHHCNWHCVYMKRQNLELLILPTSLVVNSCFFVE